MRKLLTFAVGFGALTTAAAVGGLFYLSRFVKVEGFHLSRDKVEINLLKASFKNYTFALSGFECNLKNRTCLLSSLALSLPPPQKEEPPTLPVPIDYRPYLNKLSNLLRRFDWRINARSVFYYQKPLSVNLYDLNLKRGEVELKHFEVFTNRTQILEGDAELTAPEGGLKLTANLSAAAFRTRALALYRQSGKLNLNATLKQNGKKLGYARLSAAIGSPLRGKYLLKMENAAQSAEVKGRFTFDGYALKTEGRLSAYRLNATYRVLYPLYGEPTARLYGRYPLPCGGELRVGAEYLGKLLTLALTDGEHLYGALFLNYPRLEGYLSGEEGFALLRGNLKKLTFGAEFDNFTTTLCGFGVKKLRGGLTYANETLKGNLEASALSYGEVFKTNTQAVAFDYDLKNLRGDFKLRGSLEGELLLSDGTAAVPTLNATLELFNKPFACALREGVFHYKNGLHCRGKVERLSYADTGLKNTFAQIDFAEGKLEANLKGGLEGSLKLTAAEPYDYAVNLKGEVELGNRTLGVALAGKGNLLRGEVRALLENLYGARVEYSKREEVYKGNASLEVKNLAKTEGVFEFEEGEKNLKGNFTLSLHPKGYPIKVNADYGFSVKVPERFAKVEFKPFAVEYDGLKLARVVRLFALFENGTLAADLEGDPAYPIFGSAKVRFNTSENNLLSGGTIFVKPSLLNLYLSPFGTFIPSEKPFRLEFSYEGETQRVLEGLNLSLSERFPLWSAYAYKPLEVFLSLYNDMGNYTAMVGLMDNATGAVLGSAQATFNAANKMAVANWDIADFPLRFFYGNAVHSYLSVSTSGDLKKDAKRLVVNTRVLLGGYVRVDEYKFNSAEGGSSSSSKGNLEVVYNATVETPTPIYVKTPNGYFIVSLKGRFLNGEKTFRVVINYGRLNLFGKTFYVSNGVVKNEDGQTYVDIPMTLYTPVRTIFVRVYGYLPWNRLKLEIYSVPSAPENELLMYILSGGTGLGGSSMPLSQVFLKAASFGLVQLMDRLAADLIGGVEISFVPTFDPTQGLVMGVQITKYLGDYAKLGYYRSFSPNPKATYMWFSLKFVGNSFFRFTRYGDGSLSGGLRFMDSFGSPYW